MKTLRCILLFATTLMLVAVSAIEAKPVKYVFLFIGDGMSIPQRMMTEEFLKRTENRGLLINRLSNQAITTTSSANSFITDSAASGTAIACGEKTNNGRIGMDTTGEKRLQSVAEVARDSGRKVGIVTSVTLNHATPAVFYAHESSRGKLYQIGLDLITSNFDYFGGGGIGAHNDKKDKHYKGDIYDLAKEAGYIVSRTPEEFAKLKSGTGKVISVGAEGALPYAIDSTENTLKLADFTRQGIELLDNPKGFFMMVEGGKIDWMCHANDAATTLREVVNFDNAVQVAYDFAQKHPDETLIVVTGDHETGGLTLGFAGTGYKSYIELMSAQTCSRDTMNQRFKALQNPTFEQVKPMITEMTGLVFASADGTRQKGGLNLTKIEEKTLEKAFAKQFNLPSKDSNEPDYVSYDKNKGNPLSTTMVRILNNKSSVAWTSGAHTALPVSTTACGVEAGLFSGMIDNTDIAKRLKLVVL